ncbi:MAG TPA: paraquat-inducible protein A [Caulobacteraceae bacterium]
MFVACPGCGAVQSIARPSGAVLAGAVLAGVDLACGVCRTELERPAGRSLDAALACSAATFLLLLPANLLTFLSTSALGASRRSLLASSAVELWREGSPPLAVVVAVCVIVLPLARYGLLSLVLASLKTAWRPRWLGPAFRLAQALQPWALADVALLAFWIAYTRLHATVPTVVGAGGFCFIGAGLMALFARATLDGSDIWRRIAIQPKIDPTAPLIACESCALLSPAHQEGQPCRRCGARVHGRKPDAVIRASALTIAGVLLYIPANLLPMATVPIGLEPTSYTVLEGVKDLFEARLYALGLLVFIASFAIPLLKLVAMMWFLASIAERSARRLVSKTRLYRVVEEIGRWSMVDPLVIACFVPVMQFNAKLYGRAGPAAPAFAAVVILTMVGAQAFDPRRMWDVARRAA